MHGHALASSLFDDDVDDDDFNVEVEVLYGVDSADSVVYLPLLWNVADNNSPVCHHFCEWGRFLNCVDVVPWLYGSVPHCH